MHGTRRRQQQKEEASASWWCAACGGQYEWRAPNRILVVQFGANANEAKVFKAHAAPLGLCDHLINALKLLANQQKDGDSPIQSIVTSLHERRRRGIMNGLRRLIQADNHSAVVKSCIITAEKRPRRQELRNRVTVKKRKPFRQCEWPETLLSSSQRRYFRQQPIWNCRKNNSKDPMAALAKASECLQGWHLVSQFGVASLCRRNGLQRKDFAKVVGRALLGRRLALRWRCALAHIIELLECPGEVRAARRALCLPHQGGALRPFKGSGV